MRVVFYFTFFYHFSNKVLLKTNYVKNFNLHIMIDREKLCCTICITYIESHNANIMGIT